MYIICTYDVKSKNCPTYKKLTKELEKIITDDDHVAIYYSYNSKMIKKQEIGKSIDKTRFIID